MLFNSIEFLLFFPFVTLLYFLAPYRHRVLLLLQASCLFYMAFVPYYILILFFTIVVDYFAGILIEKAEGGRRKMFLVASLCANIGILGVFKYYNFFVDSINASATLFGLPLALPLFRIVLPIGLSFHTFQAMSYTIEVYRGRQKSERNFWTYALYVMFYPQLVAGPIERPQNLLHQFHEPHPFRYDDISYGLKRMAVGMFKKVVIADNLAKQVDIVYDDPTRFHGLALVVATILFAFQIYYDFSGYSDIAVGSARAMGFRLMENFRAPYFSRSVGIFWRRWHISLSTWFKDYLYIPLGGSHVPAALRYRNLMVVFLISGLWHGANWTFLIWGALHGAILIAEDVTAALRARVVHLVGLAETSTIVGLLAGARTFALVTFAWVFFRARTVSDAVYVLGNMPRGLGGDIMALCHRSTTWAGADPLGGLAPAAVLWGLVLVSVALAVEYVAIDLRHVREVDLISRLPVVPRYVAYYFLIYGALFLGRFDSHQFIYFQF
jgi:D-alanyl-lipoteichoic acid acyltransferase DltB (MBOAT superfamily)